MSESHLSFFFTFLHSLKKKYNRFYSKDYNRITYYFHVIQNECCMLLKLRELEKAIRVLLLP